MRVLTSGIICSGLLACLFAPQPTVASAEQGDADGQRSVLDSTKHSLRYRLQEDHTLRYRVTHVAKTKTRVRGVEDSAHVHTVSDKLWTVSEVNGDDEMTFVHSVDSVEMMQQNGEQDEIRWSSNGDESPPPAFEAVQQQLNKPLSTVTINAQGEEVARKRHGGSQAQLGMGGLTIPLPQEAVPAGHRWDAPRQIKVRGENGEVKTIKLRDSYRLEKIQTGVATISVRTEVLTPIQAASIKAQVVQQLSNGTIRFDVDAGRVLSKELEWDETVVGFQGPNSLLEYRARLNEKLVDQPARTAKR